jgi:hypothetical protein
VIVIWLVESDVVLCIDTEIAGINVVSLHHLLENLWLMHSTLLHEVYDFILYHYGMVNVVVELYLNLILELPCLVEELFVLDWLSKVFVVLSQQVELADVCPGVEAIAHGILCPDSYVLASPEKVKFVDFLLEMLPVEDMRHPEEGVRKVEDGCSELP